MRGYCGLTGLDAFFAFDRCASDLARKGAEKKEGTGDAFTGWQHTEQGRNEQFIGIHLDGAYMRVPFIHNITFVQPSDSL